MRKIFKKLKPRTINYRSYKHISNEAYRESLLHKLSKEVFVNNDDGFLRFCDINININIKIDMRRMRENMFEVIKCHLSQKISQKQ